ncbi:MAG TPA: YihY/virulence factor BrkB family protein [Bryobacteraceae bacterium]|jgi:membrane protein
MPSSSEPGRIEAVAAPVGAPRDGKPLLSFSWRDIKGLLGESIDEWLRHKGPRLGASLAFYALLSFTPLLLIAVSIGGLVFDAKAAEGQIVSQVQSLIGPSGADGIRALLEGTHNTAHGILATVLGFLTLLFGASGVLVELRDALNTIWDVRPASTNAVRSLIQMAKERLFSFALVLAIGFLLLISLLVNAAIAALGTFSARLPPMPNIVLQVSNSLVSFVVITGLFASIYKVIPDAPIKWRDVTLGAAVTSLLFTFGKLFIGLYLGRASFASTYGAAASVVLMILWVYYSGQIFFLGAEFTKVFASRYG